MKKKTVMTFLLSVLFAGIAWAHAGHGAVTHPVHVPWGLQGAQEAINVHPLFVHFPIALLLTSTVFYILGTILRKEHFLVAGKWVLYFGTLAAGFAVGTGLYAANTVSHDEETHQIMMLHQKLGIAVLCLSTFLSLWLLFSKTNIPSKGRLFFLGGLLLLGALLTQQADFGGRMVFLKGVGVKPVNPMIAAMATKHTESNAGNMKGMNMMMDHDHQ